MNFRGLKLGEVIQRLERMDPDERVKFDFVHFGPTTIDSYRGYYEDAALGYADPDQHHPYEYPTVRALLETLKGAVGKVFEGWKGGNGRPLALASSLWVANRGETGDTIIVDVQQLLYVTLITRQEDEREIEGK